MGMACSRLWPLPLPSCLPVIADPVFARRCEQARTLELDRLSRKGYGREKSACGLEP